MPFRLAASSPDPSRVAPDETGSVCRHLVVCADEFGRSRGICEAVLDLLDMGRVSAVASCPTGSAWRDFARDLARWRGRAGIGLMLQPLPRAQFRGIQEAWIREIALQIAAFSEVTGFMPEFIGSHQEWHSRPWYRLALFQALDRLAMRGLELKGIWLRDPGEGMARMLRRGRGKWPAMAASALATGFRASAGCRGYGTNHGYAGFVQDAQEYPVSHDFERYCQYPGRAPLVVCRPAYDEEELAQLDSRAASDADRRVRETMYLSSTRFTDLLELLSIRLSPIPREASGLMPGPEADG
ncbi:MAG: ChbG/HpnK family deacetylase [Salinarimonas sp.]